MTLLSGKVTFVNGMAAQDITVRVFDQDAPGKGDDDLTLVPGLSDRSGRFTVEYDPGRYLDFARLPFIGLRRSGREAYLRFPDPLDILSPYLLFTWRVDGIEHTHTAPLELFRDQFRLPQVYPLEFLPSRHGFHFLNAFSGFMLPFSVPLLSTIRVEGAYGLCGGMCAGAADFLLSGEEIPGSSAPPKPGTRLHRYLFRRSIDSFAAGETILRFARWMLLPDGGLNGTYRLTMSEWEGIRAALDAKRLVPIGQLRVKAPNIQQLSRDIWHNHQVLAYGYQEAAGGSVDIRIYDPNCPDKDDLLIHADRVQVGEEEGQPVFGLSSYASDCFVRRRPLHGFFAIPYEAVDPPLGLFEK